jgi:hypothetical protein
MELGIIDFFTRHPVHAFVVLELERVSSQSAGLEGSLPRSTESRLADASREAARLAAYLKSAGWAISD